MQRYLMNFDTKSLPERSADCLVVGSGVAGLVTAWHAASAGLNVILMVKESLADSNTNKAQGGIAAVFGEDDSPDLHVADTLVAGAGLCDEDIVRLAVEEGRAEVAHLMELGAVFDTDAAGLCLGREGCHSRNRILHAKGDATGAEVVRALVAAIADIQNITILEHTYLVDLLVEQGNCYGGLAFREGDCRLEVIRAGAVVLATGGLGRLFMHTTNPEGAKGNGIGAAYRAGAAVMDMEFVQFHPTSLVLAGAPNFLISEAVRGAGGVLRNAKGERFMPRYHALADLAPRDIVARAIYNEMKLAGADSVFLDVSTIGEAEIQAHFPMITATCKTYGLDITKELIPVAPAAHYMMGGVQVNRDGESAVKQLFACGEVACTGLHGANRLASNSLLEGLAFGKRIASVIGQRKEAANLALQWENSALAAPTPNAPPPAAQIAALAAMMNHHLGLIREQIGLETAQRILREKIASVRGQAATSVEALEYRNMLSVCRLITLAALMRTESRGGHYRSDYPESLPMWQQHIIQKWQGENHGV